MSACNAQQDTAAPATEARAAQTVALAKNVKLVPTGGKGWAQSSVNAAVFRSNSLVSHDGTQYVAYYDGDGNVVLGKRKVGSDVWELKTTQYKGQAKDAHNCISIGVDGKGFLHMVWDLHSQKLRYAKSTTSGGLLLTDEMPMTGQDENRVTYPQFYNLPGGDLLFLYRDGGSGNGNAMLNRYDVESGKWSSVQHPLVAGGGQRNAYLNPLAIDSKGGIHLSWVWRDTPDVATNHDISYAYSPDQGKTWQKSTGEKYNLPITIDNAEVAWKVPKNSELINQTAMTVDANAHPFISTYWRAEGTDVPQYQLVWHDGTKWRQSQVSQRTQAFRLSGGGTKKIPISRPQIVAGKDGAIHVIFRDEELGNGISVASSSDANHTKWTTQNLLAERVGAWEPSFDTALWAQKGQLNLFVQRVGQGDGETLENVPPQDVSVLEWTP
ncbi:neuraminidase [bacterium]|nr:MAG: neuraminidase [bacterium]